jgi:hypothetical protein
MVSAGGGGGASLRSDVVLALAMDDKREAGAIVWKDPVAERSRSVAPPPEDL